MGQVKRSFDWLVAHEKVVIAATLVLIVALALQLRFCGRSIAPEVSVPPSRQQQPDSKSTASSAGRLTGTWEMKVQKPKGGVQNWILTLTQNGDELSGILTSEGGDLPVSGTVKGDEVSLSAKKFGVTVEFPAKVSGDTMLGTMRALTVKRQWTAQRK